MTGKINDTPSSGGKSSNSNNMSEIGKEFLLYFPKDTPSIRPAPQGDPVKFLQRWEPMILNGPGSYFTIETAFQILHRMNLVHKTSSINLTLSTWKDLGLLCGPKEKPEASILETINHTKTAIGRAYLAHLIASPISNISSLEKRQAIIRNLTLTNIPPLDHSSNSSDTIIPVAESSLFEKLGEHLTQMKKGEYHLLEFWNKKFQLPGSVDGLYFKSLPQAMNDRLNGSSSVLDAGCLWNKLQQMIGLSAHAVSTVAFPLFAFSTFSGIEIPAVIPFTTRFAGVSGPMYAIANLLPLPQVGAVSTLAAGVWGALSLKSRAQWIYADTKVEQFAQNKIYFVACWYRHAKQIYHLVSKASFVENLEHFDKLRAFFNNEFLKPLFEALDSSTFDGKATNIVHFLRGHLLVAWEMLQKEDEVKTLFEPALMALGEIDAWVSAATLVQEESFCFPEYQTATDQAEVNLNDFWNPLIGNKKSIKNSISIGRSNPSSMLITGPNAAGKSTLLRSVITSLILAQSLGVASAKSMKFTPFTHILSSMNPPDSLAEGTSLFQAQVDLIQQLVEDRKNLSGCSFAILDELFTGTNGVQAKALASATVETLRSSNKKFLQIFVTHMKELTKISGLVNYHLDVEKLTLRPTYQLKEGVSDQQIALDVALNRGLDAGIVQRAAAIAAVASISS